MQCEKCSKELTEQICGICNGAGDRDYPCGACKNTGDQSYCSKCDADDKFIKEYLSDAGYTVELYEDPDGNEYTVTIDNDGGEILEEM